MDRGVLYIATGESFVDEATRSAERIKALSDLNIAIVTDATFDSFGNPFDVVISAPWIEVSWGCKPELIRRTPFDNTIYMDSDTYVVDVSALEDIFDLLMDGIEVVITHDTHATADHYYDLGERPPIPFTYPWYNTGVLGFQHQQIQSILNSWAEYQIKFEKQCPEINDQAAFRRAIYESDVHPHVLPVEYNYRASFVTVLRERVRIIHAHAENFKEIERKVNSGRIPRRRVMWPIPGGGEFLLIEIKGPQILKDILVAIETIRRKGFVEMVRRARRNLGKEN